MIYPNHIFKTSLSTWQPCVLSAFQAASGLRCGTGGNTGKTGKHDKIISNINAPAVTLQCRFGSIYTESQKSNKCLHT